MATSATLSRRDVKTRWLSENPKHHEWLRQCVRGALYAWCRDPLAADMINSLKAAGVYARLTSSVDICAAMRRLAMKSDPASIPPSARACAEIEVILSREGVDRESILKQLQV